MSKKETKKKKNQVVDIWNQVIEKEIHEVKVRERSKFRSPVVPPKIFFEEWMKMPLFPAQYSLVNHIFTEDFQDWRTDINEIYLMWGEGAGKDTTCVRSTIYCLYWLTNLLRPQEYFESGPGTPIVFVNVSFKEEHAAGVYFRQLIAGLKRVKNPATGRNWFSELGMDLREGKDIQTRKVLFPNHIEAMSESSVRYTAEGKNVLLAVFDEIAEFRYDKAKALYTNLKNTAFSRFQKHYKIVAISYPRDPNDYFCTLFRERETLPEEEKRKVYTEVKASWEVRSKEGAHPYLIKHRIFRTKEDYRSRFNRDPEDATRRFMCKFPKSAGNRFFKRFDIVLERCIQFDRPYPYLKESEYFVTDSSLLEMTWEPWFRPFYSYELFQVETKHSKEASEELSKLIKKERERHADSTYFLHIDLSRGIRDYAGLALVHTYRYTDSVRGFYVDLLLQIKPEEAEIQFETIQKFIFYLTRQKGFPITKVTFDGFQSVSIIQTLNREGILADTISVDRTRKPYDTFKHIAYQGLINCYFHPVLVRELKELIVTEKGKVEHPKISMQRLREEGIKEGSKDLADALAGAIYSAAQDLDDTNPTVIGSVDETEKWLIKRGLFGFQ